MTRAFLSHDRFVLTRAYRATPARVFAAFADPDAKKSWFACGDGFDSITHELDFRVGGFERTAGVNGRGWRFTNDCLYHDIVENERMIFSYHMTINGEPFSVSMTSVVIAPEGAGARVTFAEDIYLLVDGFAIADRIEGSELLLSNLAKALGE
ncbi:MAG: polyketide cyclase [Alphaproteobacteria bacterium]|nr:polyketide cyclase [Alphaproteobacteria bacterium]